MRPSQEGRQQGSAPCAGCAKVAGAAADPWLIAQLPHSVLLLGDHQAFEGYAVLWSRVHAKEAHHLEDGAYAGLMADLKRSSAAVERATGCFKLNVASLGNIVQHAHFHLFPRSAADPQRMDHPWVHAELFAEAGPAELRRRWVRAIQEAL